MNYSALLSLSALLVILGSACTLETERPRVITVMTAELIGTLTEENGCLRVTSREGSESMALVWQKDTYFNIERQEDLVLIVDQFDPNDRPPPTVMWRLGDMVRGGGGMTGAQVSDEHAGAGFSERCPGPYFLVGSVE